jgi:hypothetical protein
LPSATTTGPRWNAFTPGIQPEAGWTLNPPIKAQTKVFTHDPASPLVAAWEAIVQKKKTVDQALADAEAGVNRILAESSVRRARRRRMEELGKSRAAPWRGRGVRRSVARGVSWRYLGVPRLSCFPPVERGDESHSWKIGDAAVGFKITSACSRPLYTALKTRSFTAVIIADGPGGSGAGAAP